MLKIALLILAALCCVYAEEVWHFPDHEFDRTPLGDAIDRASTKMLKEVYADATDKNVVTSPLGVLFLLSLYASGASEANREEIVRALGSVNYTDLFNSYSGLSQKFSALDPSYITLANKIYVSNNYDIAEKFNDQAVRSYHSEVEKINFSDAPAAAASINKWADEKTKGHIKNPVKENMIDGSVAAALFNVIFFQGHWNVPFNANDTKDKDFHLDKTTVVKKPTMILYQSLFVADSEELGARIVELPYKEKNFRMLIFLPHEIDGLSSVLDKASQQGLLRDTFNIQPAGTTVILEVPKFDIKSSVNLNKILPKVGITRIFNEGAPGIVKQRPVVVDRAFQEAFIKVDEEGATAGAFTGVVLIPMSMNSEPPPPQEFKVDHPFLYAILHEDIVLFLGTFTK